MTPETIRMIPPASLRQPRPLIRALLRDMAITDFARIFVEEAVSCLGRETAHAVALEIERRIDRA